MAVIPLSVGCDSVDIARRLVGSSKPCSTTMDVHGCCMVQNDATCRDVVAVCVDHGNLIASLNACACADIVVLVMHPIQGEHEEQEEILDDRTGSVFASKSTESSKVGSLSEAS